MFDIIIRNGKIVSGIGNLWYNSDIGIKLGKIVEIGDLSASSAKKIIDSDGLIVSPGFIDAHAHGDLRILGSPNAEDKLMQGVTTEINGQCGLGIAPLSDKYKSDWREYVFGVMGEYNEVGLTWSTFDEYLNCVERAKPSINVGYMIPYGALRFLAAGFENRNLSIKEFELISKTMEEALEQGAFGVSLGLPYIPSVFAEFKEYENACRIAKNHEKIVSIHVRNEGNYAVDAVKEAVLLGKKTGVSLHISHLKAAGRRNWNKSVMQILEIIESARDEGYDITFDTYPYDAASTMLKQILPPWALEGGIEKMKKRISDSKIRKEISDLIICSGEESKRLQNMGWDNHVDLSGWDNIYISSVKTDKNLHLVGRNIEDIGREFKKNPLDVVCDILIEEDGAVGMVAFMMSEEDVKTILKNDICIVGSDGLYGGKPHPRLYGTFPRLLGKYVRECKLFSLEEGIKKITSSTAERYGIRDRGIIMEGKRADIVIFNDKKIIDRATYNEPYNYPDGIEYVIVNGEIAVEKGQLNIKGKGQLLKSI